MATGDRIDQVRPRDMTPLSNLASAGVVPTITVGQAAGVPLSKLDTQIYTFPVRIPTNGTPVVTGITLNIKTVDDPNNADVGKVFRLGFTCKLIATGTDTLAAAGAAAEQTVDVTANAVSGIVTITSLPITTANADTPVAGSMILIAMRRIGSHANDTHNGRAVVLGIDVSDT